MGACNVELDSCSIEEEIVMGVVSPEQISMSSVVVTALAKILNDERVLNVE
jgi:hypothetical protein